MHEQDYDELVLLRTHLTVALLAISQLRRKHADSPKVARLSTYALEALLQMRDEMAQIDRLIDRLEKRRAKRDEPLHLRFPRRQETKEAHERQ